MTDDRIIPEKCWGSEHRHPWSFLVGGGRLHIILGTVANVIIQEDEPLPAADPTVEDELVDQGLLLRLEQRRNEIHEARWRSLYAPGLDAGSDLQAVVLFHQPDWGSFRASSISLAVIAKSPL